MRLALPVSYSLSIFGSSSSSRRFQKVDSVGFLWVCRGVAADAVSLSARASQVFSSKAWKHTFLVGSRRPILRIPENFDGAVPWRAVGFKSRSAIGDI